MKELKENILRMAFASREGHVPSALSILDILWVLYDKVLNVTPQNVNDPDRDYFILSKGQASLGLYVVLAKKGFIDPVELESYSSVNSNLGGHPDRHKISGVEASTGSLGHGFPMAVGLALGLKIRKSPARVFALVGDGECNEGTIWESALLASHHNLNHLTCVVDYNHSTDRALLMGDIAKKFESFGWETVVVNGHDQKQLEATLKKGPSSADRPFAVIAETLKGYGVKSMQDNPVVWHHRSPTAEELKTLISEISPDQSDHA